MSPGYLFHKSVNFFMSEMVHRRSNFFFVSDIFLMIDILEAAGKIRFIQLTGDIDTDIEELDIIFESGICRLPAVKFVNQFRFVFLF